MLCVGVGMSVGLLAQDEGTRACAESLEHAGRNIWLTVAPFVVRRQDALHETK